MSKAIQIYKNKRLIKKIQQKGINILQFRKYSIDPYIIKHIFRSTQINLKMENYKTISSNYTQFVNLPKSFKSSLSLICNHPGLQLEFKSRKSPFSLSTLLTYNYTSTILSAQISSQDNYKYKFLHQGHTLPLNFLGKFNYQGQNLLKNSISVEYKHSKCNLALKLTNHPMNLVFSTTAGQPSLGFHGQIKSNLRLNRVQKSIIGGFFSRNSIYSVFEYNFLLNESTFFLQKTSDIGIISQCIQYNGKNSGLTVQFGLEKSVNLGQIMLKADSNGNILLKFWKAIDETLQLESACNIDLGKSSSKNLIYTGGVRLKLNFNLPNGQ